MLVEIRVVILVLLMSTTKELVPFEVAMVRFIFAPRALVSEG